MRGIILFIAMLIFPALNAKPIIIGTLIYDPPFEIAADKKGDFFGFDIDLMREICKRMRADCHFKGLPFTELFPKILTNELDLAIGAISITPDRQENFLFSLPYLASSGQYLAKHNSPIDSIEEIRNKRVGVEQGTIFKEIILEKFNQEIQVIEFHDLYMVFQALVNNDIDVLIADEEAVKYWTANNSQQFKLVGQAIPIGTGYGIMANKLSQSLIIRVNKALMEMENDGTYLRIYRRYFAPMY